MFAIWDSIFACVIIGVSVVAVYGKAEGSRDRVDPSRLHELKQLCDCLGGLDPFA